MAQINDVSSTPFLYFDDLIFTSICGKCNKSSTTSAILFSMAKYKGVYL